MLVLASMSGNPVLGLLLLPLFFGGPFVLLWLEVRAFLKSEAQSLLPLILLVILGVLACLFCFGTGWTEFNRTMGFTKVHLVLCGLGALAFPFAVAWEAYKRGWLSRWTKPAKKKRRHSKDFE